MKDRIRQIIDSEELTQSEFAQRVGVQRSNISHILSGRNKPSVDFLQKLLSKFTHLNIEWILTGIGTMYKEDSFENKLDTNLKEENSIVTDNQQEDETNEHLEENKTETKPKVPSVGSAQVVFGQPDQVLVLFNDETFVTYKKR